MFFSQLSPYLRVPLPFLVLESYYLSILYLFVWRQRSSDNHPEVDPWIKASPTRNRNTNINIIRYLFPNRRVLLFTTKCVYIYICNIYILHAVGKSKEFAVFTVHIYIINTLDLLPISRWCLTMQPSPRQWSSGLWHCPSCNWAATSNHFQ